MKCDTGFWSGIGAGLVVGMLVGMMLPCGRKSMKTQVGKKIQQMGVAVDHTVDQLMNNLR
ncbi:MAG: hypothetical protein LKJ86_04220 [Oscillibacter sp.]|jgi:uncharacterized membrane-anchored protein YhcB (DUF1043 family)|nr:hypothetical protein [Oscillibacter sp.]